MTIRDARPRSGSAGPSRSAAAPVDPGRAPLLLVADDDTEIRRLVAGQLQREGYRLREAADAAAILQALAAETIDLIILDLNLPDGDGLTLCRRLRADGYQGAVIMVTARTGPVDRVLGLELGADDYLTKPFEPRELLARIRNLLRRAPRMSGAKPRFAIFGPWRLDLAKRHLIAADESVILLTTSEFDLLSRLLQEPGETLSREMLVPDRAATAAFDRAIDNRISRLRHKLGPGCEDLILTVRGHGYLLAAPVSFA